MAQVAPLVASGLGVSVLAAGPAHIRLYSDRRRLCARTERNSFGPADRTARLGQSHAPQPPYGRETTPRQRGARCTLCPHHSLPLTWKPDALRRSAAMHTHDTPTRRATTLVRSPKRSGAPPPNRAALATIAFRRAIVSTRREPAMPMAIFKRPDVTPCRRMQGGRDGGRKRAIA